MELISSQKYNKNIMDLTHGQQNSKLAPWPHKNVIIIYKIYSTNSMMARMIKWLNGSPK